MKKNLGLAIFGTLTILSFQNCAVVGDSTDEDTASANATASALIQQEKAMGVINNRCVQCHNSTTASGGIGYLNDVNSLLYYRMIVPRDPGSSILYQVIQDGSMPPTQPLTQAEVATITTWINEGFNGSTPVVTAPTAPTTALEPKFSSISANIFTNKCLSCHSAAKVFGGVNLSTYTSTKNYVVAGVPDSSALYKALLPGGVMAGKATQAEIGVIRDWILNGAQNN